jgi:hypothetical protein
MIAGNVGAGADGQHTPIPHWFYWSWNANSGDTGQTPFPVTLKHTYQQQVAHNVCRIDCNTLEL